MDDLAHRLGISKRTLYKHFSSKADILDGLIDKSYTEFEDKNTLTLNNNDLTLMEKIKELIIALPSHIELYDQVVLEQIKRSYPEQWEKLAFYAKDWEGLYLLIDQGIREGIILNKNANLIVKMITSTIQSLQDQHFYFQHNISNAEAVAQITDIILYGLVDREK